MPGIDVLVYREDPATDLLTYGVIRLYRSASPDGTFAVVTTGALVALTYEYTLNDSTGSSAWFYRFTLYNTVSLAETEMSPLIQPGALTLRRLRFEAAQEAGAAFQGTTTGAQTTTTLTDAVLMDNGVDDSFLEGAWVYRPDANATADKLRRLPEDGFDITTGKWTLAAARAWTNAPAPGETYQVFTMLPPVDQAGFAGSWNRIIRWALQHCAFIDQVNLGLGDGQQTRYSLAPHLGYLTRKSVRRVLTRTTDTNGIATDQNQQRNGFSWDWVENGIGGLEIELEEPPGTTESVIVEFLRRDFELYIDTDVTLLEFNRAVRACVWAFWESMGAKHRDKAQEALVRWQSLERRTMPDMVIEGFQ